MAGTPDARDRIIALLQAENAALRRRVAELEQQVEQLLRERTGGASPPSASPPAFVKPNVSIARRRRKKKGRPPGHEGTTRRVPDHIDEVIEVPLPTCCPQCGGTVQATGQVVEHLVEEMPVVWPKVVCYRKPEYRCRSCRRIEASRACGEIPGSYLGLGVWLQVAYQKLALGLSYGKIRRWLRDVLSMTLSRGGMAQMVQRVAGYLGAAYDKLRGELRQAEYLHADETGWRIDGVNHWLWALVNDEIAVYTIERSRGSDVLKQILGTTGDTILISDFYSAYHPIVMPKQKCLVHLLRELREARARDPTPEVEGFAGVFKRLVKDAVGLKGRFDTLAAGPYARRAASLHERLDVLIHSRWHDPRCRRWAARLRRHREEILLFLEHREVSWHHNEAERAIRPNVVIRKMCGGNRSPRGAEAHSIILSLIETCRRRGVDFFQYARAALDRHLNGHPAVLPGG